MELETLELDVFCVVLGGGFGLIPESTLLANSWANSTCQTRF